MNDPTVQDILKFWFEECSPEQWFRKDPAFDDRIREDFEELYEKVVAGCFPHWRESAEGCLAEIIVVDQFSRNIYRDDPRAFKADSKALDCTNHAIERGFDQQVGPVHRKFMYMPLQHSENREDQARSVLLYEAHTDAETLDFAQRHKDIIDRFGRFPHRNGILGRESTEEEREFLTQPGSSF